MYVTVYGAIDGRRVSKEGPFLKYEYNPPPMMAPPGSAPVATEKAADPRYTVGYEEKAERGRLTESLSYNNRQELTGRTVLSYEGNKITRIRFDKEGKQTSKVEQTYDKKDNLLEETYFSTNANYPDNGVYTYTYLEFDKQGNWTKREVKGRTAKYKGGTNPIHRMEYRVIGYYQ